MATTAAARDAAQERLIAATDELMQHKGLGNFNVNEICVLARVDYATMRNTFRKDELIDLAGMRAFARFYRQATAEATAAGLSLAERITRFAACARKFRAGIPGKGFQQLFLRLQQSPTHAAQLEKWNDDVWAAIIALGRADGSVAATGDEATIRRFLMILVDALIDPRPGDDPAALTALFVNGVR
ncbi:hypothetical protein [Lacticaseibacillus kribbianus]|uniref:hypothetical protein n=1 Tax=Lacticaseibacillus kribbianus TaxID=2926292 RepID=UPI001CD3AB3B|nr:hypothetical protein [Lacticaseibacillus kribbianus]